MKISNPQDVGQTNNKDNNKLADTSYFMNISYWALILFTNYLAFMTLGYLPIIDSNISILILTIFMCTITTSLIQSIKVLRQTVEEIKDVV